MRRAVGPVKTEAPADRPGDRGKTLAMTLIAVSVVAPDALDLTDDDLVALLDAGAADPSIERQIFLGRIGDQQHVALQAGSGKSGYYVIDRLKRRQEVTDQYELAGARQRLEIRQAVRLGVAADHFDHA